MFQNNLSAKPDNFMPGGQTPNGANVHRIRPHPNMLSGLPAANLRASFLRKQEGSTLAPLSAVNVKVPINTRGTPPAPSMMWPQPGLLKNTQPSMLANGILARTSKPSSLPRTSPFLSKYVPAQKKSGGSIPENRVAVAPKASGIRESSEAQNLHSNDVNAKDNPRKPFESVLIKSVFEKLQTGRRKHTNYEQSQNSAFFGFDPPQTEPFVLSKDIGPAAIAFLNLAWVPLSNSNGDLSAKMFLEPSGSPHGRREEDRRGPESRNAEDALSPEKKNEVQTKPMRLPHPGPTELAKVKSGGPQNGIAGTRRVPTISQRVKTGVLAKMSTQIPTKVSSKIPTKIPSEPGLAGIKNDGEVKDTKTSATKTIKTSTVAKHSTGAKIHPLAKQSRALCASAFDIQKTLRSVAHQSAKPRFVQNSSKSKEERKIAGTSPAGVHSLNEVVEEYPLQLLYVTKTHFPQDAMPSTLRGLFTSIWRSMVISQQPQGLFLMGQPNARGLVPPLLRYAALLGGSGKASASCATQFRYLDAATTLLRSFCGHPNGSGTQSLNALTCWQLSFSSTGSTLQAVEVMSHVFPVFTGVSPLPQFPPLALEMALSALYDADEETMAELCVPSLLGNADSDNSSSDTRGEVISWLRGELLPMKETVSRRTDLKLERWLRAFETLKISREKIHTVVLSLLAAALFLLPTHYGFWGTVPPRSTSQESENAGENVDSGSASLLKSKPSKGTLIALLLGVSESFLRPALTSSLLVSLEIESDDADAVDDPAIQSCRLGRLFANYILQRLHNGLLAEINVALLRVFRSHASSSVQDQSMRIIVVEPPSRPDFHVEPTVNGLGSYVARAAAEVHANGGLIQLQKFLRNEDISISELCPKSNAGLNSSATDLSDTVTALDVVDFFLGKRGLLHLRSNDGYEREALLSWIADFYGENGQENSSAKPILSQLAGDAFQTKILLRTYDDEFGVVFPMKEFLRGLCQSGALESVVETVLSRSVLQCFGRCTSPIHASHSPFNDIAEGIKLVLACARNIQRPVIVDSQIEISERLRRLVNLQTADYGVWLSYSQFQDYFFGGKMKRFLLEHQAREGRKDLVVDYLRSVDCDEVIAERSRFVAGRTGIAISFPLFKQLVKKVLRE